MSLWIYSRKERQRRSLFSIGADPFSILIAVAILASLTAPVIRWLRGAMR